VDANTFSPTVAAATLASAHADNRNLSTDLKRMADIKVRDARMRGARKYYEQESFMTVHNMPFLINRDNVI
jgi:asparaginyl-tRNA synthetase